MPSEALVIQTVQEIDGWGFTYETLESQLRDYDGTRIIVPINSFGGDVLNGLAIYNLLRGHKAKVTTRIVGYAASMGTIIALAGDRVEMPENGYFMIHDPTAGAFGKSEDLRRVAELMDSMKAQLVDIYEKKTGLDREEIESMMEKETWLTASRALELGFVDKVTKGVKLAAQFKPDDRLPFKNVPQNLIQENEPQPKMSKHKNFINALAEVVDKYFGTDDKGDEGKPDTGAPESKVDNPGTQDDGKTEVKVDAPGITSETVEKAIQNALKPKIDALNTKIEGLQNSLDEAKSANGELESKVTNLEAKARSLETENETLKTTIANLKAGNGQGTGDNSTGNPPSGDAVERQFGQKFAKAQNEAKYGSKK